MGTTWFALYHVYSTAKSFDEKGLEKFERDIKVAQDLGVDTLILEDYYLNFLWGEYTNLWNAEMFRSMIQLTKDCGIRFIPYLDVTELAIHGNVYKKNGNKWGAKNRWGKRYAAFSSIFLPYYGAYDFHTKLMCPASGWFEYFTNQAHCLLTQFEVDGIYLDRMDYRVTCYDHSGEPDHFIEGIPQLVGSIKQEVKRTGNKNLLIINDSCVKPDSTLIACMRAADYVLTELLPIDTDPRNFYWQFLANWGDLVWMLRHGLKPLIKIFMRMAFTTGGMTNEARIQEIVNRLSPYVGRNILVFSHRKDDAGVKAIQAITRNNQLSCCYSSGLHYLYDVKNRFKAEQ